ncbi:MAG: VOC family protein, partial [Alphaproteobacteria bacterium]
MTERVVEYVKDPVLKLRFLSHGTLEAYDLEKTRKFYTEFLGLEVVRTSPISLIIRLGGTNTIAVVQNPKRAGAMPLLNHNGLDVETREEVDNAYKTIDAEKEK